jgi:hypothetical protein
MHFIGELPLRAIEQLQVSLMNERSRLKRVIRALS